MDYSGDFKEDSMVHVMFNTFTSDDPSASSTITEFVNTDVHIHKDDDLTQRNNAAGINVSINFDGITGSHMIKIDTNDNTVAGFWVTGKDYFVRIEGAVIDGATINAVVGHFSIENRFNEVDLTHIMGTILTEGASGRLAAAMIKLLDVATPVLTSENVNQSANNNTILAHADYGLAKLVRSTAPANTLDVSATGAIDANIVSISGDSTSADNLELQFDGTGLTGDTFPATQAQAGNIASGTAAINTVADSVTITTGSETNTYSSTIELDGICHSIAPVGGITDFYYEFNVGSNGSPVSIKWQGYINSQGDDYLGYAYNWVSTSWEQIEVKAGTSGSVVATAMSDLTTSHVGTGVNLGKVRFRIYSNDGTNVSTDRILCSYAVIYKSGGYSNGAIWVDTNASNTNTVNYIDGVADNPVSTVVAALTLSSQIGIKRFEMVSGSLITLSSSVNNFAGFGCEWTLDLNNQSCANASFNGANVTGISTGSGTVFNDCALALGSPMTSASIEARNCSLAGDITLSAATSYYFDNCFSGKAGTISPSIDFGSSVGNTNLNIRHYSGGIEIKNMGGTGTDTLSIEGNGELIINANCSGGTIKIRGNLIIEDNVVGGFVAGGGVILDDARYSISQINEQCDTALSDYGANTVIPDPVGTAPTAIEIRSELEGAGTKLTEVLGDTENIQTRIPTALSGGNIKADALAISTSTSAADNLKNSAKTIVMGLAATGTLSITEMTTDLSISVNDQLNGRILIFKSDTITAALRNQATDISGSLSLNGKLTFTALTSAPSDGDSFIIV